MAYCDVDDLLLGELSGRLPATIDAQHYVDNVAEFIDSRLGFTYALPLPGDLPDYQMNLLKSINLKLASGRIIMAAAVARQDSTVHQYAMHLVREAEMELAALTNGTIWLVAPRVNTDGETVDPSDDPEVNDPYARAFGSSNRDARSAVEAFEDRFMRPEVAPLETWWPGTP